MTVDDSVVQKLWKLTNELTAQLVFNRNATLELKQQLADLQAKTAQASNPITFTQVGFAMAQSRKEAMHEAYRLAEQEGEVAMRLQQENALLQARLMDVGAVARKAITEEYYNTESIIETLEIENRGLREILGVATDDFGSMAVRDPVNRVSFPSTGSYVPSSGSDREHPAGQGFTTQQPLSSEQAVVKERVTASIEPHTISSEPRSQKSFASESTANTTTNSTVASPELKSTQQLSTEPEQISLLESKKTSPSTSRKKSEDNVFVASPTAISPTSNAKGTVSAHSSAVSRRNSDHSNATGNNNAVRGTRKPNRKQKPMQSHIDPPKPVRPYKHIRLTVESDRFVLQPYFGPEYTDDADTEIVQIQFEISEDRADIEKSNESTKAPSTVNGTTAPMDEKTRRISFLSPGSYSRSEDAKDYLVYGCIGSLELHTGVHFIFITSVKPLGDIEDKPVYAINKVAILPLVACEARQLLDRLAQEIIMSTKLLPRVEQQAEQSIVIQEPASKTSIQQDNYHSLESVSVVKPSKGRFSFLGLRQDKGIQKSANDLGPPSTGIKQGLSREGELSNIIPNPKRVSFDVPQRGAGNRSSTNLSTPTTIEPTLNEVAATTTTRPALSSPPSSPKIRSSQPGFFSKFKGNVLEIKPRKSAEIALTSPVLPLSDGEAIAGTTANPVNHKDASKTSTLPRIDTGHMNTSENEMRPSLSPRSPSALAAAEKFVTESTKQIADWSEEAVSGIFNTTPSFSLMRPTATSSTTAEYSPKAEHAQLASNITNSNQRAAEEEQEKYRLLDRRVIREISSIFGTGFYFSTEFNLLTSMQKRSDLEKDTLKRDAPLWQQVDKRFWWNEHLLKDFIDIESPYRLKPIPIMERSGYVEIEQCEIEQQPFMFTLISRRSRERSGLRYQRRGIDEDGNASNFVETEQLLRIVV
ncbi:Phosphatidylinositide phosphatase SAC2, partial [Lobosporangium transversale]